MLSLQLADYGEELQEAIKPHMRHEPKMETSPQHLEQQKAPSERPKTILNNNFRTRTNGQPAEPQQQKPGNNGPNRGGPEGPHQKEPPANQNLPRQQFSPSLQHTAAKILPRPNPGKRKSTNPSIPPLSLSSGLRPNKQTAMHCIFLQGADKLNNPLLQLQRKPEAENQAARYSYTHSTKQTTCKEGPCQKTHKDRDNYWIPKTSSSLTVNQS
ncbi:hypothetical protein Ancab_022159 [Ancistrocladus abbreviatus]